MAVAAAATNVAQKPEEKPNKTKLCAQSNYIRTTDLDGARGSYFLVHLSPSLSIL